MNNPESRALNLFFLNFHKIFLKESPDRLVYLKKETPDIQNLSVPY